VYAVATPFGNVTLIKGRLSLTVNIPIAFLGVIPPVGIAAVMSTAVTIPYLTVSVDTSKLKVIAVPEVGPTFTSTINVQLTPGQVTPLVATIITTAPPASDPLGPPVIDGVRMDFSGPGGVPTVVLTGSRFIASNPADPSGLGSQFDQDQVNFLVNGKTYAAE